MELADSLQTLESVSQGVGQVAKQGVDQLLKVVPLAGPDCDKVVEYFVVARSMKLLFERSHALSLGAARRTVYRTMLGGFGRGMDALYSNVHCYSNVTRTALL